jgi:hypothetical protein
MLKKFRIDAVPDENTKFVSATLMSISRRIWYSKDHSFPSEFLNTILKLYQTSIVPEFNAHFSSLTTDCRKEFADRRVAFLTSTTVTTLSAFLEIFIIIQRICDGANIVYEQLVRDGLWNAVVKTKTRRAFSINEILVVGTLVVWVDHDNGCCCLVGVVEKVLQILLFAARVAILL